MSERFFCEDLSHETAVLSDTEAHHALNVLRLKIGAVIELVDGRGTIATARIESTTRRSVETRIVGRTIVPQAETQQRLTVAAVPPKGDRFKWMIEKLTELGVDRFIPLQTTRSVVDPKESRLQKLQATIVSAMKQCGRVFLMQIEPPVDLPSLLKTTSGSDLEILIAHPPDETTAVHSDLSQRQSRPQKETLILIGPEGGFTEDEVTQVVNAGGTRISLPGSILRIETAAIALAAIRIHCRSGHTF
ncbi:MAG: 16S rRNA (uracil(1498)-N(3))-methyltransferase [Planctomycetaceae bacterium]|nr:16S rRNA (uracil(1498)-N(3))-methyltransferase [Planctomycetaceae bacterium]